MQRLKTCVELGMGIGMEKYVSYLVFLLVFVLVDFCGTPIAAYLHKPCLCYAIPNTQIKKNATIPISTASITNLHLTLSSTSFLIFLSDMVLFVLGHQDRYSYCLRLAVDCSLHVLGMVWWSSFRVLRSGWRISDVSSLGLQVRKF